MNNERQFWISTWKISVTILCWIVPMLVLLLWTQEQVVTSGVSIIHTEGTAQVIAHRAGAAAAPENTLVALKKAIEAGADWAEIDIRITKDAALIAMHDSSLERTTGLRQLVSETDARTIQGLDAGSWYASAYQGERVPTLEQLLKIAKSRIRLMIELKCDTEDLNLVLQVVERIQAAGMEGQCALACTNLNLLQYSKQLASKLETIYIGTAVDQELCELDYIDGYSISSVSLTQEMAELVRMQGKKVFVWTVNSNGEMARVLGMNIDGLITDDPSLALRLMWGKR